MRFTHPYLGAPCDERIGRICLIHGGDDDWTPVPDPPALVKAREVLLERLDEVARGIPGDGWVLGQRVYYLAEENRWEEAAELASRCGWDGDSTLARLMVFDSRLARREVVDSRCRARSFSTRAVTHTAA